MGTSSSQTPSCSPISISNKEREGPPIPKKKKKKKKKYNNKKTQKDS